MKEKLKKLTKNNYIYDYWKEEVEKLEQKDISIKIADFDYTIFSRDEQLEKEHGLQKNRWDLGPKYIIEKIGIKNFISKYYENRIFPKDILHKLDKKYDLILTAWVYEFQMAKLIAAKVDTYNHVITEYAEDKINAIIRYVIYTLQFIPEELIIYEDRPEYFVEYRDLIEDVLWVKLIINKVVMYWNNEVPSIEKI